MTRRTRRSLLPFAVAAFTVAPATASAAEITGRSGLVTLVYDDAIWSAQRDGEGEPEVSCTAETCGGVSAACGAVTVNDVGLSNDAFLGAFRQNLARTTIESAKTNTQSAKPELVSTASVATFGDNTGVSLSIRIAFDDVPTRIDYFWLRAGPDLAGITCLVADADYDQARSAFETIFADLGVNAP